MKIAGSGFRLVNIDMTHWAYEYTLPVTFVSVTSLQRTDFWEGKCRGRIEEKNGHQSCTSLVMLYHMTKYQQNYGLIEFHDQYFVFVLEWHLYVSSMNYYANIRKTGLWTNVCNIDIYR